MKNTLLTTVLLGLLIPLLIPMNLSAREFKLFHYNIKELNSKKIRDKAPQLMKVKKILSQHNFDILSLNEVQYDFPGVPNNSYKTRGLNLDQLARLFSLPREWSFSFYPANTGLNARRNGNGEYVLNPNGPGARDLADQVNFGTLPGQYSSGALYSFPKISETVINDLRWKDFNPSVDLKKFATESGDPLPEDIALFDKNLTDIVMDVKGEKLHLVLLHTVPSFHFGNEKSPNYERNRDQLRFLEWYLSGKTDINVRLQNIKPIAGKSFLAVGDFNADVNDENNPGGKILKRIFKKTNLWIDREEFSFTNEGATYGPRPFRLMLDYIVTSKNVVALDGAIIHPNFQRIELGCGDNVNLDHRPQMVLKTYEKDGQECKVLVAKEYELFKDASDHYPIWGHFQIK